jgi:hypothetical protein
MKETIAGAATAPVNPYCREEGVIAMEPSSWVDQFSNPGCDFRGAPFWAWNGKLAPAELRRQIRLMKEMGLGGFFMHSRVGLGTAYLSEDWFDCVKACIDEAKKQDMRAWLYDEDRWPSGAAGGLVTADPRHRLRRLVMRRLDGGAIPVAEGESLALFRVRFDGERMAGYSRLPDLDAPADLSADESLLLFSVELDPASSWYNGQTYLDTMDREAVGAFIEVTHEAYRRHVGTAFGGVVPGIFTDEPAHTQVCMAAGENRFATAWSRTLAKTFAERYGYDLLARLPELFYDRQAGGISTARYHYHDCITAMFVDAFGRQIGEWCERHGMLYTGHLLEEDTLSRQTNEVGSCLRFYEYMQAPGMDLLTEHWRIYDTAKQVSSAAHQFGRKWRLTETYGCTGWDFPFAGHKALGDWQAALGINVRCQHLAWYTMQGEAKRDYPAGIFYQSPWWREYPKVEDYFARINLVMAQGEEVRDILVIHPVESAWTMTRVGWRESAEVKAYDRMLVTLRDSLLAAHLDFDYGDEEILSRHGGVEAGEGAAVLRVAKARYTAVVVPPLHTLRGSTLALLRQFRERGGLVVFVGPAAGHVDAVPSTAAQEFAARCVAVPFVAETLNPALVAALAAAGRRVSIRDAAENEIPSALYLLRETADAWHLFVCNTGHSVEQLFREGGDVMVRDRTAGFDPVTIALAVRTSQPPVELDAESGLMYEAVAERVADGWEVRTSLPALGSRLLVFPKSASAAPAPVQPRRERGLDIEVMEIEPKKWDVVLTENNVLALDRPAYRIDGGSWRTPEDILRIDRIVRAHLGVQPRGGAMVQPWARPTVADPKRASVELRYEFAVKDLPDGELFLAMERPETFRIRVNGVPVSTDVENGWWCDRSMAKIPVPSELLRKGKNQVELVAAEYDETHSGLEIVYLLGRFGAKIGARGRLSVGKPVRTLRLGDWTGQGLPFYAGSVVYQTKVRPEMVEGGRLILAVPEYCGVAVRVAVDGAAAGVIAWAPNEVDVTDLLADKTAALLQVEVVGHRRNSHGPLHYHQKWPDWTGPGQFTSTGAEWVDDYQLVPCGLMAPPVLIVRQ